MQQLLEEDVQVTRVLETAPDRHHLFYGVLDAMLGVFHEAGDEGDPRLDAGMDLLRRMINRWGRNLVPVAERAEIVRELLNLGRSEVRLLWPGWVPNAEALSSFRYTRHPEIARETWSGGAGAEEEKDRF